MAVSMKPRHTYVYAVLALTLLVWVYLMYLLFVTHGGTP